MDHLCYFLIVFDMHSRVLIDALWSPAGKGLTSWLWYLIVSIPDLCPLSYFVTVRIVLHILAVLVQWPGHKLHTN